MAIESTPAPAAVARRLRRSMTADDAGGGSRGPTAFAVDHRSESRYLTGVSGESPGEPVPRLPRGRGLKLSGPELLRVLMLAVLLVFLIVSARPCSNAVSRLVTSFGSAAGSGSAAGKGSGSGSGSGSGLDGYERLRPGMTDDEVKAAIERARARTGSGSATAQ
jgi:hypothetical protein